MLVVAGVLAVVAVAAVAIRSLTSGGGGGADSPEAAVEDFAEAASSEDLVGVAATVAPDEVRQLADLISELEDQASESGFANSADTYAGIDLEVEGLELDVDEVGDDVAKVTITDGEASYSLDEGELGERGQDLVTEETETSGSIGASDIADEDELGEDPFVMVVRRDGGWYVSLTYTVLEYVTEADDLPSPDFDVDDELGDPAEDPEAAVQELVEAGLDPGGELVDKLPEDEWSALVAYEDAITELLEGDSGSDSDITEVELEVDDSDLEVEDLDDGAKKVVIHGASGTVSYEDFGEPTQAGWELDGLCLTVTERASDPEEDCALTDDTYVGAAIDFGDPYVVVVEERGGWVVSPASTLVEIGRDIVPALTPDLLLTVFGRPDLVTPTGEAEVGETLTAEIGDAGVTTYTITPEEDVEVLVNVDGSVDDVDIVSVEGGETEFDLTAGTEYRLVLERDERGDDEPVDVTLGVVEEEEFPGDGLAAGVSGELDPAHPQRRYLFTPTRSRTVTLDVEGDADVEIDGADELCFSGDDCDLSSGTEYTITVSLPSDSFGDAESVDYTVTFEEEGGGGTGGGGATIDGGTTASGTVAEEVSSFHDVEVDEGVTATIVMTPDGCDLDIEVDGQTSFEVDSAPEEVTVTGPFSGELEVEGFAGATCDYQVEITTG